MDNEIYGNACDKNIQVVPHYSQSCLHVLIPGDCLFLWAMEEESWLGKSQLNSSTWKVRRSIKQIDWQSELTLEWPLAWNRHSEVLRARQARHSLNANSINIHTLIQAQRGGNIEGNLAWICALSPQCHALTARDKSSQICKDHRWLQHGNMAAWLRVGDVSHFISILNKHSLPHKNTGPER